MGPFKPDPGNKFTLADIGVLNSTPCDVIDALTAWGERLCADSFCAVFLRDVANRRIIVKSAGPLGRARLRRSRYVLSGSLTDQVCDETDDIFDTDTLSWSPAMPEIEAFGTRHFVAVPIKGPAGDGVGMVGFFTNRHDIARDEVAKDAHDIATLIEQRIMLKATLATLNRVAKERQFVAIPPRSKH